MFLIVAAMPSVVQASDGEPPMMSATDVSGVAKIGRLQRRIQRWEGADHDRVGALSDYSRFKQSVKKATGLSWSMPVSYLQQWGLPDGGRSAGQLLATPGLDWELFRSRTFGTASLQFAYTLVDYPWRQTGASIADHLGVIAEINDFPGNDENSFDQLSYTQTFPGNKLLLTIGQYPLSNFDDNQYLADQQQNFNNLLFTQNGSQTYPVAGLGAYAQVNITRTIQLAAGVQNATDIAGTNLSSDGLSGQSTAWFAYAQWMPKLHGLGEAQYGFAYFDVPAVPEQAKRSTSWSFNAVQHLNDTWAIFGRANGAWGYQTPIQGSYVIGAAMNDPLGRSTMDQVGFAIGYARAADPPAKAPGTRSETVVEAYWNWRPFDGLLLTPDVQYIGNPANGTGRDGAWIWSLRTTLLF